MKSVRGALSLCRVVCAVFIFLVRGCYHGDYIVNGQELDAGQMVMMLSKITFHVIAVGVMFLAALLSMRIFGRERDNGTQSSILSKPITRWQYVAGKVLGLWVLLMIFMFVLHGIVFIITSINLKIVMPEYLFASLLCSFNLLFVVVAVLLLSLVMPDIAAFLCIMGIGFVGFVADGIFALSHNPMMAQAIMQQQGPQSRFYILAGCLLFVAETFGRAALCIFIYRPRRSRRSRLRIPADQHYCILPYSRRVVISAFQEGRYRLTRRDT